MLISLQNLEPSEEKELISYLENEKPPIKNEEKSFLFFEAV